MGEQQKPGKKMLLGEILIERGLVTKEQLEQALRIQVGGLRRLGSILVGMKVLTAEQLTGVLSAQFGLPVVDVDREFRPDVRTLLPRYLCRKYSVLPLSRETNNVLRVAMVDPADAVAVEDVEHYTGSVVQPVLAKLSDIDRAIGSHVAFSWQDLFNPQVYRNVARLLLAGFLVALVVIGAMVYRMALLEREGTRTERADGSVLYKNRDLMIDIAKDGSVYFSGRGAYASGYYGVRFENPGLLATFIRGATRQFSDVQIAWMDWLLREKLRLTDQPLVASNG